MIICQKCDGSGKGETVGVCPECREGYVSCQACVERHEQQVRVQRLKDRLKDSRPPEIGECFPVLCEAAKERAAYDAGAAVDLSIDHGEIAGQFELWLDVNDRHLRAGDNVYRLFARHKRSIVQFLNDLGPVARREVRFFCKDVPFDFARKDAGLVVLVKGITADFKLNLIHFPTAESRAKRVADMLISPVLGPVEKAFREAPGVAHYAVMVSYGAENFVSPTSEALKSECVAVVVPAKTCREFTNGKITFALLLRQSDCFVADRYRGLEGGVVKVGL